jgi:hypothetical protein
MLLEYRITFDTESRKGEISLYQGDDMVGDSVNIKHLHVSETQSIDYIKDDAGKVIGGKHVGPKMVVLTMTGDSNE